MIDDRNLKCDVNKQIFKKHAKKLYAYLKKTNTKGSNYDPFRNTGYTISLSAPICVKGIVKQISPESRLAKEIGEFLSGAILIIVMEKDVSILKNAEKIKYNNNEYVTFNKSLGNKARFQDTGVGFYTVVLFRTGV